MPSQEEVIQPKAVLHHYVSSFSPKLHLDKLAPAERTLFIDADCLCVGSLEPVFDHFAGHAVSAIGGTISDSEWFGNIATVCQRFKVPALPKFNGGVYYLEKGELSDRIYAKARELEPQYDEIGLVRLRKVKKISFVNRVMKVDVSVIIPTYNRLWCLPKAIEFCRNTYCSTEIIVIDDGSTDGTWEWLQTQPDIISLRQDNWGKCWAVNRGFAHAKGKYVRFLDSDDWLCPGANDGQYKLALAEDADVVVGGHEVYSEDETLLYQKQWTECDDFVAQQMGECDSSHYSAYLFRKDFIENIPHRPDFAWRDDRLFVIEVAMENPKVAIHLQPTLCHRHHSQSRLQFPKGIRTVATNLQHLTIYKKCLNKLSSTDEMTLRRRKAACKILWPLAHWIAYTHLDEACEVAEWIYQLDPGFHPPESGLLGKLYKYVGFKNTENLLLFRRKLLALFIQRS